MDPIRLAVVGAGAQCTESLMPGIPYIEEIDLVAVCDLQEELAARNARNFGARAAHTDVATMLRDETPDAVMVVGPPQVHLDVGLQVIEAGCHLFIEKPAAPTIEGARQLVDAAAAKGVVGQVGHMMRHADPIRIAADFAAADDFGEVLSVESRYTTWPTRQLSPDKGWGTPDEDWSYMMVQGGHPIDLIRHFLGPIARVAAFRAHGAGSAKVYQVSLESVAGKVGFLNLQDSYNGWTTGLEIVGDKMAIVTVDDLGRVSFRRGECHVEAERGTKGNSTYVWEPHHTLTKWQRSGYGTQLQHFAGCIQAGESPMPSLYDGYRNLVVGQAILDACESGQVVAVPADD